MIKYYYEDLKKLFDSKLNTDSIEALCESFYIKNYIINDDGSVDVNENVILQNLGLTKIPIKFNKIEGSFNCSGNDLVHLENSPKYVKGKFNCCGNYLNSLEGCPVYVGDMFYCFENYLKNLKYCPKYVGNNFYADTNNINTLKYLPEYIGGNLFLAYNNLTGIDSSEEKIKLTCDLKGRVYR